MPAGQTVSFTATKNPESQAGTLRTSASGEKKRSASAVRAMRASSRATCNTGAPPRAAAKAASSHAS